MLRRTATLMLAGMLAFSLAACSNTGTSTGENEALEVSDESESGDASD